jgi:hypothetical protein
LIVEATDAPSRVEVILRGDDDRGDKDGDCSLNASPVKGIESFSIDCFRMAAAEFWARAICALTA